MKKKLFLFSFVFYFFGANAQTIYDKTLINSTNIFVRAYSEKMLPGKTFHKMTVVPRDSTYALIAGGSKGIGYAIAEALAKRGYNLLLIARLWMDF